MALRSTSVLRSLWGPPCRFRKATVGLYGGGQVVVDYRTVQAVYALNRALIKHGYRTRYADTGGFVCRAITGGTLYSLHAYGTAIDINWSTNPYGPRLTTDMPRAMVDDILAIRTNNGAQVWGWGGDFTGNKDAMHFQVVASPAELANGIRIATPQTTEGFGTMTDAEIKQYFDAVNLRLDALGKRLDDMETDRLLPTTKRVRVLLEHENIPDPA